jgi:N-acetylglucosamine-6-phosphate deacetylase
MTAVAAGCAVVHSGEVIAPDASEHATGQVLICEGIVRADCPHDPVLVDASGCLVSPGLVDIHLHGALGHDLTDANPVTWCEVLDAHLAAGTTTALATLATAAPTATAAALATAAGLMAAGQAPTLAGVHLEGPCLNPDQRGAHDVDHLQAPAELLRELTPLPPALRMVTLAPELPGADDLIRHLRTHHIRVSAGHSSATPDQLAHASDLGLTHLAHLWSGQSGLTRPALHRLPGLLEASLASTGLTAEIIADGQHLPAELLTIALRCLGPQRLCLVSDASAGTGMKLGETFHTGTTRGLVRDGYAATADGSSLCGSVTTLGTTVARMSALTGACVRDVLTMATATPARTIGLYPAKGSLMDGAAGDVVLFSPDLVVRQVLLAGRPVSATPGDEW